MTITGTEQRVYGTLTGCIIDLHRFALVSGSTTDSPTTAVTVTYADTTPYKQCGYMYQGFITLFLSTSGTSIYAATELRICKNDPKRIVLETYGTIANTVTGGISVWFNKGSDASPDWKLLNSAAYNTVMTKVENAFTFTETKTKKNGSILIDCCPACTDCYCKNWFFDSFTTDPRFPDGEFNLGTFVDNPELGWKIVSGSPAIGVDSGSNFLVLPLKYDNWVGVTTTTVNAPAVKMDAVYYYEKCYLHLYVEASLVIIRWRYTNTSTGFWFQYINYKNAASSSWHSNAMSAPYSQYKLLFAGSKVNITIEMMLIHTSDNAYYRSIYPDGMSWG